MILRHGAAPVYINKGAMPTPPALAVLDGAANTQDTGVAAIPHRPRRAFGRWLPQSTEQASPQPQVTDAILTTAPDLDPITESDFVRIDGTLKPGDVSEKVWGEVFPGDYKAVLELIGYHFMRLASADAAVLAAVEEIDEIFWQEGTLAPIAAPLSSLLPAPIGGIDPTSAVRAASMAVARTAEIHWRTILAAPSPSRAAFAVRTWHAVPGTCLACGFLSADEDPTFQGDSIHLACMPAIKVAGPVWGEMVAAKAQQLAAEDAARIPEPEPIDDDEDSFWPVS